MNPSMHEPGPRITVACKVHFKTGGTGRKRLTQGTVPKRPTAEGGQVPRLARLMALAIHFDDLIRKGIVRDYADIARLGHVTRARATQIMNLLNLAPDIQEGILLLPSVRSSRDEMSEREVRHIAAEPDWHRQRHLWQALRRRSAEHGPVSGQ